VGVSGMAELVMASLQFNLALHRSTFRLLAMSTCTSGKQSYCGCA
jgi:hypothetical protein